MKERIVQLASPSEAPRYTVKAHFDNYIEVFHHDSAYTAARTMRILYGEKGMHRLEVFYYYGDEPLSHAAFKQLADTERAVLDDLILQLDNPL